MADKNLYLFYGDHYMVMKALQSLIGSLDISLPEINVTGFKTMPAVDTLIEACAALPMMADRRLVYITDYPAQTSETDSSDTKRLAAFLPKLPETTVLAFVCEDAPDKRRALYKRIAEAGVVREFPAPKDRDCAAFAVEQARTHGMRMSAATAAQLVRTAGCDYYAMENEVAKLAIYAGDGEITAEHVRRCASRTLDYNIFELHNMLVRREAANARALLADVLDTERPEGLIGLFAKKFRDMYKVRSLMDRGLGPARIAQVLEMKEYPVQMLISECARFSRDHLQDALRALAGLDYAVKSGEKDALLAMTQTLFEIYSM